MMDKPDPLRLGMFVMPIHDPAKSLAQCIDEDLELAVKCNELGFDDFWVGETTHPDVVAAMKTVASKGKAAGKFIGSGLGANREFARLLIECGVQWLQMGNDFEYMINGCETAFNSIRNAAG